MQQTLTSVRVRVALAVAVLMAFAGSAAGQSEIVLQASSASTRAGQWVIATETSAAGGMLIRHPDADAARISTALASPGNYFELTFQAEAGKPYRLWVHGRADRDYWGNDSVHVQFDKSVTSSGSAAYRIGTSSAAMVNLEDCSSCGLSGWKWQDNGYGAGVLGPAIYFATTGTQKLRVQTREDGLAIDQVVLSAGTYLKSAPTGTVIAADTTLTAASTSSVTAAGDITLAPAAAPTRAGKWTVVSDTSAIGDKAIRHPNAAAAKITTALASPANYFEMTFEAVANTPYRLWLHGRAEDNYWGNDSVYVQFDKSVTSSGSAAYRIGTSSAAMVNLEDCSGCGLNGWQWQDNGYGKGVLGPKIYFASSGTQKIRVQTREDGLAIDRIILSPSTYLTSAPSGTGGTTSTTSTVTATEIKLAAASAPTRAGKWTVVSDASAIGGSAIRHADAGASKIVTALSSPSNYFEMTFNAVAGTPYRLWVHGRADRDHYFNDSVHVQFSGSVTSSGSATYRIGTTSAAEVNLEDCGGCGLSGWKWQDNGYGSGVLGPTIYFATTGTQKLRVQTREDGLTIDEIRLSPSTYLKSAPAATSTTTTTTTSTTTTTTSTTTSTTGAVLKVLHWNIHHGVGTDGVYNIDRIATWMAKIGPDVISVNEVERYTGWGYEDQPARFASLLKAKTGQTWYAHFVATNGSTKGQGNMILSRIPFESTGVCWLSSSRNAVLAKVMVNGRLATVFSTHLDAYSSSGRTAEMKALISCASGYPQQRILAGDYNAWPGATEIGTMTSGHYDAWAEAVKKGTQVSYSDNPNGNTRNSRIDYVFYSKWADKLVLKGARVYDTRTSSGVMPSDHRPLMATFEMR